MIPTLFWPRLVPDALQGLSELAVNLVWSWYHATDALWQAVDPELWEATQNPWAVLSSAPRARLEELAENRWFCSELSSQLKDYHSYLAQPTWYSENYGHESLANVAFFSMEFGLNEALPIYAGGLGVFAGDYLKSASDLGVPVIGVGLLYQHGSFRQGLDSAGNQVEFSSVNNPAMLPILPLRDDQNDWLRVEVDLPGRALKLRCWQARVGRVHLFLLDSNDPENLPGDRGITGKAYGSGTENRLQQQIVLGIGGWRMLTALKIQPSICHFNEADAIFAALERAYDFMADTGVPFATALSCVLPANIFTCNTPERAGLDQVPAEMIAQYFRAYALRLGIDWSGIVALGRANPENDLEPFFPAYMAARCCGHIDTTAQESIGGSLFEPLFQRWPAREIPIGHADIGIHLPSWESRAADDLWTIICGKDRWNRSPERIRRDFHVSTSEAVWGLRNMQRRTLVECLKRRWVRQATINGQEAPDCPFDANILTIAVVQPFTASRRPDLLLHEPDRLVRLLNHPEQPAQIVIAGKAHPEDEEGKRMLQAWVLFMRRADVCGRVIFLADYDLELARELAQGVDLWINMPRPPGDATGMGGIKVLVNGGLNLAEPEGWWGDAYAPEVGWIIGNSQDQQSGTVKDEIESAQLLKLLENEVIPAFYLRDDQGIPLSWVNRVRESMARLAPRFSTHQILRHYLKNKYLPGLAAWRRRSTENGSLAVDIQHWKDRIAGCWQGVSFENLQVEASGDTYIFNVTVALNGLASEMVRVELYAEPLDGNSPLKEEMIQLKTLAGGPSIYRAVVPADRPADDYTPRIIPRHNEAQIPLEESHSLWFR